jgi:hypothetical protein
MPNPNKRLILANGEKFSTPVKKASGGAPKEMPRSYDEARALVKGELARAIEVVHGLPAAKRFGDEVVLCLRLHPDMVAKSYEPKGIFAKVQDLENVGSRSYRVSPKRVAQTKRIKKELEAKMTEITGRLVFVRSNDQGFKKLLAALDSSERSHTVDFRKAVQSIERFDLLSPEEQLLGFAPDWQEGRVEIVLHPSHRGADEQQKFIKRLFAEDHISFERIKVVHYAEGPLFVSCRLTRAALESLAGANPLRTAHPLVFGGLTNLRSSPSLPAPQPPPSEMRSTIKVGIFDGGVDVSHPALAGFVEQDESLSIRTPSDPESVAHGTAVAGAVLYGALNPFRSVDSLPAPQVSVVSFRALPTSNKADEDLYESIDVIEAAVPARKDIKVYNLSFGPRGPIYDDSISRFTYALDFLSVAHKVVFFVAVGNDGDAGPTYNRIQAPSDLVNGFGVGAYSKINGRNVHAPYSCRGPGRECGKIKPDISAFGGCEMNPIHLLSSVPGMRVTSRGTSFASPIAASVGARAIESFDCGSALLSRALLIHGAKHPTGLPDDLFGHGIVPSDLDDLIRCNEHEATIVYQGSILPTSMIKLPVMLPPEVAIGGKVRITWTVAGLPRVTPNHPWDYTSSCLEDTFYPNAQKFRFQNPNKSGKPKFRDLHRTQDAAEIASLKAAGWKQSLLPLSKTGNQYREEVDRRAIDCKWEPIVRRSQSLFASSLHEPFLVLHCIPRNGASELTDYAAVVTIAAPNSTEDLYNAVIRRYPALQPIRLRSEAQLRVRI